MSRNPSPAGFSSVASTFNPPSHRIAAHGNSLRALVKHLDGVSDDAIVELNIPTGVPLLYELNDELRPLRHEYLGDPEQVRKAQEAVARQGKAAGAAKP